MELIFLSLLTWVPAMGIMSIGAICLYIKRDEVIALARAVEARKAFSNLATLPARSQAPSPPAHLHGLHGLELREACDALVEYARGFKPDWILGVHPGGRLLSVYVGHLLGIPADRCLFVSTCREYQDEPEVRGFLERVEGKLLVIDDISRSGATLHVVKDLLEDLNRSGKFDLGRVAFAALTVVTMPFGGRDIFRPDWTRFGTTDPNFHLPWTGLSREIRTELVKRKAGQRFDAQIIDIYEDLISNQDTAYGLVMGFLEAESESDAVAEGEAEVECEEGGGAVPPGPKTLYAYGA